MSKLPHMHLNFGVTINPNTFTFSGCTNINQYTFNFSTSGGLVLTANGISPRGVATEMAQYPGAVELFYYQGLVLNRAAINHIGIDILTVDRGLGVGPRIVIGGEFGPGNLEPSAGISAYVGGARRQGNLLAVPCPAYNAETKKADLSLDYDGFLRFMQMSLYDSIMAQHPPVPDIPE